MHKCTAPKGALCILCTAGTRLHELHKTGFVHQCAPCAWRDAVKKRQKGAKTHPQNTSEHAHARAARDGKGRFLPGQSGNPGGRPVEEREMKVLARSHTVEAIEKLVHLMRSAEDQRVQFLAAEALLDRGHGRAAPAVASGPLVNITMAGAAPIADAAEAARIYADVMAGRVDVATIEFAPALPAPAAGGRMLEGSVTEAKED